MARAALILVCAARVAAADPARIALGLSDGVGWASRAGTYRDDAMLALRVTLPVHDAVALDVALHEDLERLEPAFGLGARLALDRHCYLRGELALVGATQIAANFDATAALGFTSDLMFVEAAAIDRFGDVDTLGFRVEGGISVGL